MKRRCTLHEEASAGQVLLDWMEQHAGAAFVRAPITADALNVLRRGGAPAGLVAVYASGGAGVHGLLPYPFTLAIAPPLPPDDDTSWEHMSRGDSYPLTDFDSDRGLLVLEDGSIALFDGEGYQPVATSLEQLFLAQLEALQTSWSWHPERRHFVPNNAQPDRRVLLDSIAAFEPDAAAWLGALTAHIRAGLLADTPVRLAGLGRFTISHRSFSTPLDGPKPPPTAIPVFRPDKPLHNLVNGGEHEDEDTSIDGPAFGSAQAPAIYRSLRQNVSASLQNGAVSWPGLGEFALMRRRAFVGHRPRGWVAMQVPEVELAMAVFRPYPELKEVLNPHLLDG